MGRERGGARRLRLAPGDGGRRRQVGRADGAYARPAREGSWEDALHRASGEDGLLVFSGPEEEELLEQRDHRAIGVVYNPGSERSSNYVPTLLSRRYDAFLYLDETRALRPLHPRASPCCVSRNILPNPLLERFPNTLHPPMIAHVHGRLLP
jgi:erythromycin esterase